MNFNEYFNTMMNWDAQVNFVDEWNCFGKRSAINKVMDNLSITKGTYSIEKINKKIDELMGDLKMMGITYTIEEINETVDEWYETNN